MKGIQKKSLALIMALIMILALVGIAPFTAQAADPIVVADETELAAALAALADGDIIQLADDITYTTGIYIRNMSVTFDLNGFILDVQCDNNASTQFGDALEVSAGELILIENGGEFNAITTHTGGDAAFRLSQ